MREIKFRVWDGKRMQEVRDLHWDNHGGIDVEVSCQPIGTPAHAGFKLMQSIGKNKVFEGDIVRVFDHNHWCICDEWDDCSNSPDDCKDHGVHRHEHPADCEKLLCTQQVKWSEWGGYFTDEEVGDFCPPLGADYIGLEVIGNIYENPELLHPSHSSDHLKTETDEH